MGFPHPDCLLPLLTYVQFAEWQAYYQTNPWGEGRADDRLDVLCRHVIAPHLRDPVELPPTRHPYGAEDRAWLAAAAEEFQARRAAKQARLTGKATDGHDDRETEHSSGGADRRA